MIEFNGKLTGDSNKLYYRSCLKADFCKVMLFMLLPLPGIVFVMRLFAKSKNQLVAMLIVYFIVFLAALFIALLIVMKKKESDRLNITIANGNAIRTTNKRSVIVPIDQIHTVREYADCYVLVIPFRKMTADFICQNNLLCRGTREDFKAAFDGKITSVSGDSVSGDGSF